jgi:carbamoyl-phosphate synthase large subunit
MEEDAGRLRFPIDESPDVRSRSSSSGKACLNHRLLVLDAGSVASNNFMRSLKSADPSFVFIGCATDRFTLQRSLAERNYLVARAGGELLRSLSRVIKNEQVDLAIANSDSDVKALSELRDRLPCRTLLPKPEVIKRCADKFELMTLLRRHGISVPDTYAVEHVDQLERIFRRLTGHSQLWCRIRKGSGSIGAIPVRRPEQAKWWIEYWEEMRGVPPGMFTLAEYLPGRDITVQCVFRRGKLYITKMLHRLAYNVIGGAQAGYRRPHRSGR